MRKKTVIKILDSLMWTVLYCLPVIAYLIINANNNNGSYVMLGTVLEEFAISKSNIIYVTLDGLIGSGGVFEMFTDSTFILYLSYFCIVNMCHVLIDVIVFIPRLCHKYMNVFYQDKE